MRRNFVVVVKAVIVKEGRVLVLCRSQLEMQSSYMNNQQKWDLSGGSLHFHERAEEGLLREVKEETTLEILVKAPLSLFDVIKNHIHLYIFTYACGWKSGQVYLSPEHDAYVWMDQREVQESDLPLWMKRDLQQALLQEKSE